jgi:hypothetical protein
MTAVHETAGPTSRDAEIGQGIRQLVATSGENSAAHGFHEDWPTSRQWDYLHPDEAKQVRRAISEKLCLVHEETSEALGEIRSNRPPLEIYYVDHKGLTGTPGLEYEEQQYDEKGVPLCKPEGFLVEAGDAIIRLADLAYLVGDKAGGHLAHAIAMKQEYNATRPFKHGRQF